MKNHTIFIKNQWFSLNPDASKCRSSTYNCNVMKTFDFQCKSLDFSQKISFSQNYSAIFYYIIPTGHTDIINHNPPTFANVTVYFSSQLALRSLT